WIAGLLLLLRDPEGKGWRVLGITYLVIMLCMLLFRGRMYYPGPAYPMVFANAKRTLAEACLHHCAGGYRNHASAFWVFSVAECQPIHCVLTIPALSACETGKSPDGPVAANLCRPVRLERNGAGSGRCLLQPFSRRAKELWHFCTELWASGDNRFFRCETGFAPGNFWPPELFLLGTTRFQRPVFDRDG